MNTIDPMSPGNTAYPHAPHTQDAHTNKNTPSSRTNPAQRGCWLPENLREHSGSDIRPEVVEAAKRRIESKAAVDSREIAEILLSSIAKK